jgi:hypothetical protein
MYESLRDVIARLGVRRVLTGTLTFYKRSPSALKSNERKQVMLHKSLSHESETAFIERERNYHIPNNHNFSFPNRFVTKGQLASTSQQQGGRASSGCRLIPCPSNCFSQT